MACGPMSSQIPVIDAEGMNAYAPLDGKRLTTSAASYIPIAIKSQYNKTPTRKNPAPTHFMTYDVNRRDMSRQTRRCRDVGSGYNAPHSDATGYDMNRRRTGAYAPNSHHMPHAIRCE